MLFSQAVVAEWVSQNLVTSDTLKNVYSRFFPSRKVAQVEMTWTCMLLARTLHSVCVCQVSCRLLTALPQGAFFVQGSLPFVMLTLTGWNSLPGYISTEIANILFRKWKLAATFFGEWIDNHYVMKVYYLGQHFINNFVICTIVFFQIHNHVFLVMYLKNNMSRLLLRWDIPRVHMFDCCPHCLFFLPGGRGRGVGRFGFVPDTSNTWLWSPTG